MVRESGGVGPPALALENLLLKFPANFRYNGKWH